VRSEPGSVGITSPTVRSYITILETIYLVRLTPAWSTNQTTRAVTAPKVMFTDTGLAGFLTSASATSDSVGSLLENFVLGELARQLTWSETRATFQLFVPASGCDHQRSVLRSSRHGAIA
jgi:predicted AAA+ superfamily ATPase